MAITEGGRWPRSRASIQSLTVPDWLRPLFRAAGASGEWHAPRINGFSTTTYCDKNIEGPLEIAREDRAEREGRCATCATRLTPTTPRAAVKKADGKKAAAKKAVSKPAQRKKSNRAPVARRSVRSSRRGTA